MLAGGRASACSLKASACRRSPEAMSAITRRVPVASARPASSVRSARRVASRAASTKSSALPKWLRSTPYALTSIARAPRSPLPRASDPPSAKSAAASSAEMPNRHPSSRSWMHPSIASCARSGEAGTRARRARRFCQWRSASPRLLARTHSAARRLPPLGKLRVVGHLLGERMLEGVLGLRVRGLAVHELRLGERVEGIRQLPLRDVHDPAEHPLREPFADHGCRLEHGLLPLGEAVDAR